MTAAPPNWKRLIGQMLFGAVLGGATTALVLASWDGRGLDPTEPNQMLAVAVGIIYGLTGLVVAFGILLPGPGSKLLNVEDSDELRDERPRLGIAALGMILAGTFFLVLAAAVQTDTTALLSPGVGGVIAAACLAGMIGTTILSGRSTDEFTRLMSVEASATAMHITLLAIAVTAVATLFGIRISLSPLGLIAALGLLLLVSTLAVCGKHGLLMPRA